MAIDQLGAFGALEAIIPMPLQEITFGVGATVVGSMTLQSQVSQLTTQCALLPVGAVIIVVVDSPITFIAIGNIGELTWLGVYVSNHPLCCYPPT